MGIVSKLFPRDDANAAKARTSATTDWIDLSDYQAHEKTGESGAATWIRFAELRALDDLKQFSTHVYDGSILVIDFSKVQGDEILLRRLTNELRKLAQDTGGDLAGLGDHHILLTPTGVKVARNKLVAKHGEDDEAPPVRAGPAPAAPIAAPTGPPPASAGAPPKRTNGMRR